MYKRLKSFFGLNGLFFESQYGFRDKHSTQHALIDIVKKGTKTIWTKGCSPLECLFGFKKKAFDTVDHDILLDELYRCGIRGIIIDWF